ncbi:UPF0061-domain-containing protein [Jaminaea rosea]|uniref:Selenoprotein O n=1 Tax=Jaminaea rosea TaxID=1569628 RepID=A0A316UXF1_9BASI|nr:UPF0061-domain-containing protein [Jaminaea rosea]PWN29664.1 UPF0061-domain-containing protein [Jaminaea rosea]
MLPLLSLPLPPLSQRVTHQLLPDGYTPSPTSLISTQDSTPSLIRRSRPVPHGAAFSYVSPLTLPFPYEFPKEEVKAANAATQNGGKEGIGEESAEQQYERQMNQVEGVLRRYEVAPSDLAAPAYPAKSKDGLAGYVAVGKQSQSYPSARLLGISPAALEDCLPELDVGDSFDFIAKTTGRDGPDTYSSGPMAQQPTSDEGKARYQLSDVLGGRAWPAVLPSNEAELDDFSGCGVYARKVADDWKKEDAVQRWERRKRELATRRQQSSYAGWSQAYAGHQFGSWAGQLGDGRAITLFETLNNTVDPPERWEVQLKGAGRTPYSRFADGLAVLASSVREYLGSEIIAAMGIPTSRALAVVSLPDVDVMRERRNPAAITTRLAQSWIRIGSFQLPASRADWEAVRLMGEYVSRVLFRFDGVPESQESDVQRQPWAKKLLLEAARRNARMAAGWQSVGWTHGVLNTDNISILGLTIDYGPYGFLDIFDQEATPNHSDDMARYSYKMQPSMVLFAIKHLATSLSPILGFEDKHGRAPSPGELVSMKPEDLEELSEAGEALVRADVDQTFVDETMREWKRLFRNKLALEKEEQDEKSALLDPLLEVLEGLDFTLTQRKLKDFLPVLEESVQGAADQEEGIQKAVDSFVPTWYDGTRVLEYLKDDKREQAVKWLTSFAQRTLRDLGDDGVKAAGWGTARSAGMAAHCPRFVLRNWVGQEVVQRLEEKHDTAFLQRVLEMCLHPYEEWGSARDGKSEEVLEEERRLCEVGTPLERNMPSCSS